MNQEEIILNVVTILFLYVAYHRWLFFLTLLPLLELQIFLRAAGRGERGEGVAGGWGDG